MKNNSGIRVVEYNVLVKPVEVEAKTKGGLLLADSIVEKEEFGRMEGVLVGVSPMAFKNSDWPADAEDQKPKVGDKVIFSRYGATKVTGRDAGEYWLMKDTTVIGVFEDE
jgi:chaperonin GroES